MVHKIGIVGCGGRLKSLVRLLNKDCDSKYVYYVHDLIRDQMLDFKKEFGDRNCVICNDYEEILNNNEIKWIMVGSINSAHCDQIIRALKQDKNIFSEKPLAISFEECKKIKEIYDKSNSLFLVSYPLRHSKFYLKIREIINSGNIGEVISLEFNEVLSFSHGSFIMSDWRRFENYSGGHLLEKCCHDFDLVNWLLNSIPIRVFSFGGLNFFNEKNRDFYDGAISGGLFKNSSLEVKENPFISSKDIVDNQVAVIEYLSGARATFHTSCNSAIPERRMYICGTKGTIRADLHSGEIELGTTLDNKGINKFIFDNIKGGHGGGDFFLIEEFKGAIENSELFRDDLNDSIKSAISCIMIDESRKKGVCLNLRDLWKSLGYF